MAQYMFLLYDSEDWYDQAADPGEFEHQMKLHGDFTAAVEAAGARIFGGEALERTTTASTVRNPEQGDALVTDGPFIETKEALGGFYLVECRDLDQAIALAKQCPSANVEIRPVMDVSGEDAPPA